MCLLFQKTQSHYSVYKRMIILRFKNTTDPLKNIANADVKPCFSTVRTKYIQWQALQAHSHLYKFTSSHDYYRDWQQNSNSKFSRNPYHVIAGNFDNSISSLSSVLFWFCLYNGLRMPPSFFSFYTSYSEKKWASDKHNEHFSDRKYPWTSFELWLTFVYIRSHAQLDCGPPENCRRVIMWPAKRSRPMLVSPDHGLDLSMKILGAGKTLTVTHLYWDRCPWQRKWR